MSTTANSAATRRRAHLCGPLPVIALLACHAALGLSAMRYKSMTFDEGAHLTGGFHYWALNDYRLQPENGNLSQRTAGLPLWLSGCRLPALVGREWHESDVWHMSDRFLFDSGNDADTLVWRGRMMMVVPSILLGLLVYLWSRRLFGPYGGLMSLTLYAFSPTMLANGFLTTSDLCVALFFTAAVGALWGVLHRVSLGTIAMSCLALGGLLLSKFSGVLIVPIAAALVCIRLTDRAALPIALPRRRWEVTGRFRQLAVFAAVGATVIIGVVILIWASYGFRYAAFAPGYDDNTAFLTPWSDIEQNTSPRKRALIEFARNHHLLPEAHLYGFCYTLFSTQDRISYLCGQIRQGGRLAFFPFCFVVKTPLEFLLILILSAWAYFVYCRVGGERRVAESIRPSVRLYDLAPLLVLVVVYAGFALTSRLNIGHRHLLPIYPPLFIAAGLAAAWFQTPPAPVRAGSRRKRARHKSAPATIGPQTLTTVRAVIGGALVATVFEALWFWPNYLAYFNLLVGGPRQAYKCLVDSSLDWGQDLAGLKRWLEAHPDDAHDSRRVYLSYFGTTRPEYYDIEAQALPGFRPRWEPHVPQPLTGGLYCLSASMLQTPYMAFPGRWNVVYENAYQQLRSLIEPAVRAGASLADIEKQMPSISPEDLQIIFRNYEDFRFGRLASFLRRREPDDNVGHSILIFRLSDADVARAIDDPPCELLPKPETEP